MQGRKDKGHNGRRENIGRTDHASNPGGTHPQSRLPRLTRRLCHLLAGHHFGSSTHATARTITKHQHPPSALCPTQRKRLTNFAITRWNMIPSKYPLRACPTKFSTVLGAWSGNSRRWISPKVVCTTAVFAKRDASDFAGAAVAIVCSSRVGFSLKMSRSPDLSLVVLG